jgi:GNAT superfamily N-acetyltransferase
VLELVEADFSSPRHAEAILVLMDDYTLDPMGGGGGLSDYARANLVSELARRPTAHGVLAFQDGEPAGLVLAFEGFSTFACKPLLNIHDVMVSSACRGKGISSHLLARTEELARQLGCCKLTLEVVEGNAVAQALYRKAGYAAYELANESGRAMFWQRKLDPA